MPHDETYIARSRFPEFFADEALAVDPTKVGAKGVVAAAKLEVTGRRDSAESALKNLLTVLATAGVIRDSTTAN